MEPNIPPPSDFTTPFLVTHQRRDLTPGGNFRPQAVVQMTPLLRTSGLLLALPPDEVKSLLFMLTFVTPNGVIAPALVELADAMHQSPARARVALLRLTRRTWQGQPLAQERRRESGLDTFHLASHLITMHHEPVPSQMPPSQTPRPNAGREAVIAQSRATYARPRADVEAEIARLNGWEYPFVPLSQRQGFDPLTGTLPPAPEDVEKAQLREQLRAVGMTDDTITQLLTRCELAAIRQQLDWLPYRQAKDPARFLYSAIVHAYAMPPNLRNRERLEAALEHLPAEETGATISSTLDPSVPDPAANP